MIPKILRVLAFLVGLLLVVTLSGCGLFGGGGGGSENEGGGTAPEDNTGPNPRDPVPPPQPLAPLAPSPDPVDVLLEQIAANPPGSCPNWAPDYQSTGYTGLTGNEAKVYSDVLICTHRVDIPVPSGRVGRFLTNKSDGVWHFTGPSSEYRLLDTTPEAEFFRASGVPPAGLPFMAPGDSVSITDWTNITWVPNPQLTAAWATQEFLADYLLDRGAGYVGETLKRKTGHSAAIPNCMVSAYKAAKSESELEPTSELVDRIQNELKASAAISCFKAMEEADARADAQGYVRKTKVTWNQHVNKLSGQVDNGLQVGKYLNFTAAVCSIIPKCRLRAP